MKLLKVLVFHLILLLLFSLSACKNKKTDDELVKPAYTLYQRGLDLLANNKYTQAAKEFEQIFFQHPGDNITPQAELMSAYALFLAGKYDDAIDVLDTFSKLHPLNVDIAYAHYLRALAYYMQVSNVELDQTSTALAKASFEELITRFPGTKYAIDAALKIDLVNDHLAGKEMAIGRYYLQQQNPSAAANRFQRVLDKYQTTSHTPEALYRLTVSYLMLGLDEEATKYAAVLGNNYLNSKWYKYSYDLVKAKGQAKDQIVR